MNAIRHTRARSPISKCTADRTIGPSDMFALDVAKQRQWRAFLRKATHGETQELAGVVTQLRGWLWPLLRRCNSACSTGRAPMGGSLSLTDVVAVDRSKLWSWANVRAVVRQLFSLAMRRYYGARRRA